MDLLDCSIGRRNIAIWDQFPVSSEQEAVDIITRHMGYRNIGISTCAYVNGDVILLFLFFDFDSKDISLAWEDAKMTYVHFSEQGTSCMLNFSGKKGFHVLVELEPKNYSSKQLKDIQKHYRDLLGLETLDEQTFGDKKRIFRLPWTFNIGGTWCRTLAYNDGLQLDLDEIIPEYYPPDVKYKEPDGEIRYYDYPCVEYLADNREFWLKARGKYEPSEPFRLTWAGIRIWRGNSIDDMLREMESYEYDDWDMDKTRKKLEYLEERKWTPHSCQKLKELGYCIESIHCKRKLSLMMKELGIGDLGKNGYI
jgi:hypothetical protein